MPKISFPQQVYKLTRRIPRGRVTTYGRIARALGNPGASRAVGNALNRNPYAPQVPCHRVIRADGSVGGFASGPARKMARLRKEGIIIKNGRIDLREYNYEPKAKS